VLARHLGPWYGAAIPWEVTTVPSGDSIDDGLALHQAGRLQEASAIYRRVLQQHPEHPDALYLLGTAAYQAGDAPAAADLMRRAILADPSRSDPHNMLGLVLEHQGKLDEAEGEFREAISLSPDSPRAYVNLGSLLARRGKLPEAVATYRRAIGCDPGSAVGHYNLGNALRMSKDLARAAEAFRTAAHLEPNFVDAMANLASVLHAQGLLQEAVEVLGKALRQAPNDAGLHAELGDVHQTARRFTEAVESYRRALALDKGLVRAGYGMGCAQMALGDFADSTVSFRAVLSAAPDHVPSRQNLGKALFKLGSVDEALEQFRQAAALDPAGPAATSIAVAIPGSPSADNQAILDARKQWWAAGLRHGRPASASRDRPGPAARVPGDRLRIGYVSGFFHRRNWMKPVWGLINSHDRDRFEIHLFCDATEAAIHEAHAAHPADCFHEIVALSNEEAARRIEQARIDILVDLNGFSYVERLPLFAHRPAPVIVGWFNMYATTGADCFDYLIGDECVIPPEEQRFYTERIIRVPGSYLTFQVGYPVPEVAPPPCAKTGQVTFGCLASQYKITPQVVQAWSRILRGCRGSRMIVKNAAMGSAGNRAFLADLFKAHGVGKERIELDGPAEHFAFLKAYDRIDIALDTFPYNGGTTTMEAIWQGVPVLSFRGDRWAARTSESILRAGGLGRFVAADLEGCVAQAVELASDPRTPQLLQDLRLGMRDRLLSTPACDTAAFARNMEQAYHQMARGIGKPPER
jgi:predicted O-linked N-acetylglucosamine transferase (SPINDLY family)